MEETYTKSQIMEALSKIGTPHPYESPSMKDMYQVQYALCGAETLVEVILGGMSKEDARLKLMDNLIPVTIKDIASFADKLVL